MNALINAARGEAERLGVPLRQSPPEVFGEPGARMTVCFPARGGKVCVRLNERGETVEVRYRPSLLSRLLSRRRT